MKKKDSIMIDIRSDATVEAVAKALCKARYTDGTTWESLNKYIQRDWLDYACLAIDALLGQLQMSETDQYCDNCGEDLNDGRDVVACHRECQK